MLDISVKQMKYAVEIAHCESINQAAQNLYVSQSSLSKAMKELENVLGYAVFQRGSAGTTVTEEGREFLQTAEKIVYQLELLERQTRLREEQRASIKVSIPRATYITYAFTKFFQQIQNMDEIQINFAETNSKEAVDNILYRGFHFGIIRYPDILERNTIQMLQQKKLLFRQIWTFDYMLLVSRRSELASRTEIHPSDLMDIRNCCTAMSATHTYRSTQKIPAGNSRESEFICMRGEANLISSAMYRQPICGSHHCRRRY